MNQLNLDLSLTRLTKLFKSPQMRRYLIAGFIAFLVDFLTFRTLYVVLNIDIKLSAAAGIILGFITSFILQKFWSFKGSHTKKVSLQIAIYVLLTLINTLFTEFVVLSLEKTSLPHPAELGKILATCFIVIWNFAIFKLILFKEPRT